MDAVQDSIKSELVAIRELLVSDAGFGEDPRAMARLRIDALIASLGGEELQPGEEN